MKTTKWTRIVVLFAIIFSVNLSAQEGNAGCKEPTVWNRKDLKKKSAKNVIKEIRKEALELKKQGYKVFRGRALLDEQLGKVWTKKLEIDKRGCSAYYISSGTAIAPNYTTAVQQANNEAKADLTQQIQDRLIQLFDIQVTNNELSREEATLTIDIVNTSKNIIFGTLEPALPLVEIYRKLPNGNIEVMVTLGRCVKTANTAALDVIKNNVARESKDLAGKIQKIVK